jgi:thymidylate synthase
MCLLGVNNKVSQTKNELAIVKNRNINITEVESRFNDARDKFGKHYNSAVDKHNSTIDEIDKMIKRLNEMRDLLTE